VDSLPEACTLLTLNFAGEPFGMTTPPPDVTSFATVPVTVCPAFALFELTV
jgi:hypothetical protein